MIILLLMLLLFWPCLLLQITLYLVVINECRSEAHGAHVEFVWWGVGVGCGLYSHFRVQPNYSVKVVLHCVVIGVVTTNSFPVDPPTGTEPGKIYPVEISAANPCHKTAQHLCFYSKSGII